MLSLSAFAAFALIYTAAVASPGPGVAAVVARVLACGRVGLPAYIAGLVAGDLAWFCIAAAGLSVIAKQFAGVFLVIKFGGAAYLLFIAWKIWTAPVSAKPLDSAGAVGSSLSAFLSAASLTLGNPKVIAFFLALLPTVIDLEHLTLASFAILGVAIATILSLVMLAYALAAGRARSLFASAPAMRRLNRATGTLMAGVAVAVATR